METKTITLELSVEKANVVMQALSQMPYSAVVDLIADIQRQASGQLNPEVAANDTKTQ